MVLFQRINGCIECFKQWFITCEVNNFKVSFIFLIG